MVSVAKATDKLTDMGDVSSHPPFLCFPAVSKLTSDEFAVLERSIHTVIKKKETSTRQIENLPSLVLAVHDQDSCLPQRWRPRRHQPISLKDCSPFVCVPNGDSKRVIC